MIDYMDAIAKGECLGEEQMMSAMRDIMEGKVKPVELEAFLTLLAERGETVEEITGAAKIMREKASGLSAPYGAVDCCGTGGDAKGTYNVSTAVAIVAAACGVPMAKHGNRASSSKSGAADVLEDLGVNLDVPPAALEEAMSTIGFAFLMAPAHHKAMVHVKAVRQKMQTRTIFNILGPLANPAGVRLQLMGVFDRKLVVPMAEVLKSLGSKRAWVVHGSDGLDEITTTGETYAACLDDEGNITERVFSPEDFGVERLKDSDKLIGGESDQNAAALRAVLEGQQCPYRDIVVANVAAVLCVHNPERALLEAADRARSALDSGAAMQVLKDYITFSREAIGS